MRDHRGLRQVTDDWACMRAPLHLLSGFESPCQVKHKHKDFLTACEKCFEGREVPNNTAPPPYAPATKM